MSKPVGEKQQRDESDEKTHNKFHMSPQGKNKNKKTIRSNIYQYIPVNSNRGSNNTNNSSISSSNKRLCMLCKKAKQ